MVEEVPRQTLEGLSLEEAESQIMENIQRIMNDPQYMDTAEEEIE